MGLYSILISTAAAILLLYLSMYGLSFIVMTIASLKKIKSRKNQDAKDNPKVAVLIPVLNESEVILDCINSLEKQDYKNL
jgi:cellulose synthase/poly-beta-1,6-N-acetylglucosamine synthase-like glycosyltransferase